MQQKQRSRAATGKFFFDSTPKKDSIAAEGGDSEMLSFPKEESTGDTKRQTEIT